ncbi:MAG: hypothetical protein ACLFR6_05060 [Salinarchaeum sp.]
MDLGDRIDAIESQLDELQATQDEILAIVSNLEEDTMLADDLSYELEQIQRMIEDR